MLYNKLKFPKVMGQCMEEPSSSVQVHPKLGRLSHQTYKNKDYLRLRLAICNEEDYMQWSKKINKVRYNPELNEYLYTPVRQEFKQAKDLCQASHYLECYLEPYDTTLREIHLDNIRNQRYPSEPFLWRVLLAMVKMLKYNKQQDGEGEPLLLENVLVWHDGRVKIISEHLTSNNVLIPQYEIEMIHRSSSVEEGESTGSIKEELANMLYSVGFICVALADLKDYSRFFSVQNNAWKCMTQKQKQKAITNIELRYSHQLTQTLTQILTSNPQRQITLSKLLQRAQQVDSDNFSRRQIESTVGLGVSMVTPIKGSQVDEVKMNNNSNLLKLSTLKYDISDKASTNMQVERESEELDPVKESISLL